MKNPAVNFDGANPAGAKPPLKVRLLRWALGFLLLGATAIIGANYLQYRAAALREAQAEIERHAARQRAAQERIARIERWSRLTARWRAAANQRRALAEAERNRLAREKAARDAQELAARQTAQRLAEEARQRKLAALRANMDAIRHGRTIEWENWFWRESERVWKLRSCKRQARRLQAQQRGANGYPIPPDVTAASCDAQHGAAEPSPPFNQDEELVLAVEDSQHRLAALTRVMDTAKAARAACNQNGVSSVGWGQGDEAFIAQCPRAAPSIYNWPDPRTRNISDRWSPN